MKSFEVFAMILAVVALSSRANAQEQITLGWPVACQVGETCEIQHYVDHGGGGIAKDFRCGTVTYKGHNGTDIACSRWLMSAEA